MVSLYGIVLINFFLGPVSVADVSLLLLAVISIVKYKTVMWDGKKWLLIIYILSLIIPWVLYKDQQYFDSEEFVLSMLKLIFYVCILVIVPRLLSDNALITNRIVFNSLKFTMFIGFLQIFDYYLPINLHSGYSDSSLTYGVFRISSVYSEPSFYFYSVMLYFYLIVEQVQMKRSIHLLMLVTTVLSFSMTTYSIYFVGLSIINLKKLRLKGVSVKWSATMIVLVLISIILYIKVPILRVHISNLLELKPSSATTRVFGGAQYALNTPIAGVGAGNEGNYYLYNLDYENLELYTSGGAVNNILAVIKLYSGYIGLITFLFFLFSRYRKLCSTYLSIVFVSFFGWGHFNTAGFFFLLILLETHYIRKTGYGGNHGSHRLLYHHSKL